MNIANQSYPPFVFSADYNQCNHPINQFLETISTCDISTCDISTMRPSYSSKQFIETGFPLEACMAFAFFLLMLGALLKAWHQTRLRVEMGDGRVVHLRKFANFGIYLQRPKLLPTIIISSTLFFIFILGNIVVDHFFGNILNSSLSDFIAIAIAATSVLFPLVILIMDASKSERSSIFPTSEILLKYAYAFPISILLLVVLILSAFQLNYYWMRSIAVVAVISSGIALLRLLNIIFGPKAWKETENALLSMQVADSIAVIAYQRAGVANTSRSLENLSNYVSTYLDLGTHRKNGFIEKVIKSNKTGSLTKIDISVIEQVIRSLLPEDKFSSNENPEFVAESSDKAPIDFKIIIRAQENEIIDDPDETICVFRYKKNSIDENRANKIAEKLTRAFKIDSNTDTHFSSEQLDLILLRIKKLGQEAIVGDNEILSASVAEAYITLTKSLIEAFSNLSIKYTLENIKNESPFYGMDWKPLTGIFEDISDWTERFLQSSNQNRHIRDNVIWLPYRLCLLAFSKREILIFSRSIDLSVKQQWFSQDKATLLSHSWIKSLLDYYIGPELEKKYETEGEVKIILNFIRLIFKNAMILTKATIDHGHEENFLKALKLVSDHPTIFKYDDVEQELKLKESSLRFYDDENKKHAEDEIKNLKSKQSIIDKINNWREEINVGLATYCLMLLENKGSPDIVIDDSFLKRSFQVCLNRLPSSFEEIVRLRIRMNHFDVSERWGFESWEHIPSGQAKFMEFDSYKNKTFGYLILKSYQENISNIEWNRLNLSDSDTYDFRIDPNSLRGLIPTLNLNSQDFNIPKRTEEELKNIESCFDSLVSIAKLNTQLRVVYSEISDERIRTFKEEFVTNFLKNNRIRKIVSTNIQYSDEKRNQWGINVIEHKECFIQEERLRYPNLGADYGQGIARDEEGLIFEELSKDVEISNAKFASDLIKEAVKAGVDVDSMVLFASRDIYLSKIFQADPAFRHVHQVKTYKGNVAADAYIEFSEDVYVPIMKIYVKAKKTKNLPSILLVNIKDIRIDVFVSEKDKNILPEIGFSFILVNPLDSSEDAKLIREHFVQSKPDWLQEIPEDHKNELMGLRLWLRVLQKIQVTNNKKPLAIYSKSNNTVEKNDTSEVEDEF